MPFLRPLPWLLACALLCGAMADACAETVRLAGGKTLDVTAVRFLAGKLEVTLQRDGGTARVLLRFDQLDRADLLPLWDRTHSPEVAQDVMQSGALALELGALAEAASRYEVAARLDPALGTRRDAGFQRIRVIEARAAVGDLERRVRAGRDLRGAVILGRALLEGSQAASMPAPQRRRIETLARLADKLAARDAARRAREDAQLEAALAGDEPAAPAPAPEVPAKAPAEVPVGTAAVLAAIRDRIAAHVHAADEAREAAADPKLSALRAARTLERAAEAYLLARRLVREAPAALHEALAEAGDDLRVVLAATYLDLADLYRQEGYFDEARARVRAALILDPGNEHAWEQRRLIEDDLKRPPYPYDDEGAYGVQFFSYSPSPFYALPHGGCRPYPVPYGGARGGFHFRARFGFGGGHTHAHSGRRVIGRRR